MFGGMPSRARKLVLVVLFAVPACTNIGVREAKRPRLFGHWQLSAPQSAALSPRSVQTLRIFDLDHVYERDPSEAAARLHEQVVREPHPDTIFALSEMHYLRGLQSEKKKPLEAIQHYYRSCGYAQHYLLASCDDEPRPGASNSAPPLSPRDAFDPRFRVACELYNDSLCRCLRLGEKAKLLDARREFRLPRGDTAESLPVVHAGFAWKPEEFGALYVANDFEVVGLANHYHDYGLGVPLIAMLDKNAAAQNGYYVREMGFPVTAFLRFDGGLADLDRPGSARLELYNPKSIEAASLGGKTVPLEADLTTPLAHSLNGRKADELSLLGFFRADQVRSRTGLKLLEPYQPGKIPVLFVHGLLSTPVTWAPMFNDLQADPFLRERYQFWVYFYPTADPYLTSAADLRRRLTQLRDDLDPQRRDPALDRMVVVGHSMGGLISKLLTVDGGDDYWNLVSDGPFETVKARPEVREQLRETFYFRRRGDVSRVVFVGTPHRGSQLSPSLLVRQSLRFVRIPQMLMDAATELALDNPKLKLRQLPTSVDLLAPDSKALAVLAEDRSDRVRYHSVIGVAPKSKASIGYLLTGDDTPGDEIVPYASAHVEGVESELVVPASHFYVHQHPLAVREVRRILIDHAREK
jgi:pimeloyl-ACP methyl ester carboxylesterase